MTILNFRVLMDLPQHLHQPPTEVDRSFMSFLPFTSFQELLKMAPNEDSNHFLTHPITFCQKALM
jgi:hypothetical protein